jgi:hypothetical protein
LRRLVVLLALVAFGAAARSARADGDPASDYLISRRYFVSFVHKPSPAAEARLRAAVDAAARGGVPIRVALIAAPYDLGSVGVLYKQPQRYAKFLGQELSYLYRGRLLVVMPNGYGLWRKRPLPRRELAAVAAVPPPNAAGGTKLALAADRVTRKLLQLHGIRVAAAPAARAAQPAQANETSDRVTIAAAALVVAGLVVAVSLVRHRLRRTGA